MQEYVLSCFQHFTCLASVCPDTCCQSWEVMLDPETLQKYRTAPGTLGEALRAAIVTENGETYFELKGGFCPFLDENSLCRIQRENGESWLSENCAAYPRFTEIYGGRKEQCLALSCPEATRLLLAEEVPIQIISTVTPELPPIHNLDPERFLLLSRGRTTAIAIVQDRNLPWERRMALLLLFTQQIQTALDTAEFASGRDCCGQFADPAYRAEKAACLPAGGRSRREILRNAAKLFLKLEPLRSQWQTEMQKMHFTEETPPDWQREHFLVYFLYRYFLKAVNDNCLVPRVRAGVISELLLSTQAWASFPERLKEFSREVEHSADNLARLWKEAESADFAALEDALL